MSVVIVGGNECMTRRYIELCEAYNCKAKVFPKLAGGMRNVGSPDLLILFTNTMSHKMRVRSSAPQRAGIHASPAPYKFNRRAQEYTEHAYGGDAVPCLRILS